ncbi:beta strand repeat-containing protein [Sphingomonas sp.]|uniref:beta strand repeat-containing protein n=1 Tax=Sphingomonas sp. TaxID=28214 RepID=UPI0035C7C7DF
MATVHRKAGAQDDLAISLPHLANTNNDVLILDWSWFEQGYGLTSYLTTDTTGGYRGYFYLDSTTRNDFVSIERFNITATNFADEIATGNGNDVIKGMGGNDRISAGAGRDTLDGGAGIDGFNKSFSALNTGVTVNLTTNAITASQGTIRGFEYFYNVVGTSKNDTFISSQLRGNDSVQGGDGNDRAEFRVGSDSFTGGTGNDTLKADMSWWTGGQGIQMSFATDGAGGFRGYYYLTSTQRADFASTENFEILGTKNNDRIDAGSGNDTLSGNGGNDDIRSGAGTDVLDGGAGIDGLGRDFSAATAGVTVNLGTSEQSSAYGTIANFEYFVSITGSNFADTFVSTTMRADDLVNGGGGNDTVTFFEGYDTFNGGLGSDRMIVDFSGALVSKGIEMSFSVDSNGGWRGYYYVDGNTRADFTSVEDFSITGTAFNDRIITGDGDDTVVAGAGADLLSTGGGTDTLNGGAGIDGIGRNFINAAQAITVNLGTNTVDGIGGSITNFEYFYEFVTGSGDDALVSTAELANDSVTMGGGDDTFTSFRGDDDYDAGLGNDRLVVDWSALDLFAGVTNNYQVADTNGGWRGYLYINGEARVDYTSVEAFTLTGTGYRDVFYGQTGNDILNGGAGDDTLYLGSGNDKAFGGEGVDGLGKDMSGATAAITLNLNTNALSLKGSSISGIEYLADVRGGSGADKFITLKELYDDVVAGNGGNDTFSTFGGDDDFAGGSGNKDKVIVDYSWLETEDRISTSMSVDNDNGGFRGYYYVNGAARVDFTGTETFDVTGTKNDDSITGGGLADTLRGGEGRDSIAGGAGADKLFGNAGADTIDGGDASDQITGGTGGDTMTGGGGADTFIFGASDVGGLPNYAAVIAYADRITDFDSGVDKINLSAIDANTGANGNQAFSYIGDAAFSAAGQIRYVNISGATYILGNLDADLGADFAIRVDGELPVAADFNL